MEEPKLDVDLHIRYWRRCLKSFLPTQYTHNDSSRMALAYFILSSLDLLGAGADTFSLSERSEIKDWFLSCQHPSGGFCGSPNQKFPDKYTSSHDGDTPWLDGAQLPVTYFAVLGLNFVDGLEEIKRLECLAWLKKLQREDGSFGELLGVGGKVEGGSDMRYCYTAVGLRWLLMKDGEVLENDIDVEKLVAHLRAGETYDGGISESALHEAHGGYAHCAIAALSLLGRLPPLPGSTETLSSDKASGLSDINATIRWLMERQHAYVAIDEDPYSEEDDEKLAEQELRERLAGVYDHTKETPKPPSITDIPSLIPLTIDECYYIGQNGRSNKPPDTCYSFWNCGALNLLGQSKLVIREPIRRFLLEQTQHQIGGFGKTPGNPPDIYHSFLALAALATMKEPVLKELDTALCVSVDAKKKIEAFKKTKDDVLEFSVFDLITEMVKAGVKGEEGDGLKSERERLVAGARKLKGGM